MQTEAFTGKLENKLDEVQQVCLEYTVPLFDVSWGPVCR